jgi:signal transduction histidine kinase
MEWFDSIIEEDKNKVLAFINKLRNQEYAFENYHITGINGEKKYILVKGYQNKDKHGKVIDVFGISSDITEFTKISNRLHLNDKLSMVGTLAAGIAHEINNPIAWIRGNLAYIKKNISRMDSIKLEELMDETIEGVDRIIDIVSELKGFSRNNNNELSMTDLHSIIDSALKIASSQIKSHVNLKKNYADNLPLVNVNPGKMQQVFLNLILNAIQSMNNVNMQNNILRITTTHNANQIRIDISDTGSGITPENISKIFDPFFTTKEKDSGTGIGLSISHEIIKNHGGEIAVKSTVGQGTTFSVFLPIGLSL